MINRWHWGWSWHGGPGNSAPWHRGSTDSSSNSVNLRPFLIKTLSPSHAKCKVEFLLFYLVVIWRGLGMLRIWNLIASNKSVASEMLFVRRNVLKSPGLLNINMTAKPDVWKNFYKAGRLYYVLFLKGKNQDEFIFDYSYFLCSLRGVKQYLFFSSTFKIFRKLTFKLSPGC